MKIDCASATIQVEEEKSNVVEQVRFVSNPYDLSRILTFLESTLRFWELCWVELCWVRDDTQLLLLETLKTTLRFFLVLWLKFHLWIN